VRLWPCEARRKLAKMVRQSLCGLIHRGGREAQKADDVAGREDMRLGGPVVGVDGDSSPLIRP
jgi:hypothetical protein